MSLTVGSDPSQQGGPGMDPAAREENLRKQREEQAGKMRVNESIRGQQGTLSPISGQPLPSAQSFVG